jgi:two-component system, cell cycle sensor histidine kinase and response regulator CckA
MRCLLFIADGALLTVGSARMWRSIKEAARSEAWHRQLVQTAAEGIWVHGDDGLITYANARMAEILGIGTEDIQGRNVEDFFLPADRSMERVRAANLRSHGKVQFDRRLRRSDGAEVWVLACCNLIDSETKAGVQKAALAMMTDITERKHAETALRRSEERFRNLFEGVLEGVYQSTPEGRIVAANPMLLKMLGLANHSELNDVHIAKDLYVDPGTRRRLLERLEQEGGFQNVEYELRRRDGQVITVCENARVVRDEGGAVLYYEGTLTDITPRKQMEEQLRQSQKVEALGRLAGGVAQDFNNVLTIITGFSQLALAELAQSGLEAGHPARLNMEQVLAASESALALTRQLLSFSRRQAPAEGGVDLNQAIMRAEGACPPDMKIRLMSEPAPVSANQTQIELVLQSLCSNVKKNFPSESLEIGTAVLNLDEEFWRRHAGGPAPAGPYAVLSLGMAAGAAPGARDARVKALMANSALKAMEPSESAAMGLSAAHATVTQCGGFIVGQGEMRQGEAHGDGKMAAFHVFLPCAAAGPGVPENPRVGAAGETILLVEDEPLVRELSRDMLERQGYRVILAANAKEAEQLSASAGSFDLLITDAVMPTISGAELARRMRAAHPGLKVLYISGYAESEQPDRHELGVEGAAFLQKPFSADSLGRKIRQMFKN